MTLDELISALIITRAKGGTHLGASEVHVPSLPDSNGLPQTKRLDTVEQGRRQVWLS